MTERAPLASADASLATDVLIVGAGPVGMALALALAGSRRRVLLIDARPHGAWADDPRALALAHGSRQLLERLQAWNAGAATAIGEIHVSQRGGFGRSLISCDDYGTPALGYVMRYRDLADALNARLAPEQLLDECMLAAIETGHDEVAVNGRGDALGQQHPHAALLTHPACLAASLGAEAPEEVRAHDPLDGPARVLREHEALQRRCAQRMRRRQEYRRPQRHMARIDGDAAPCAKWHTQRTDRPCV